MSPSFYPEDGQCRNSYKGCLQAVNGLVPASGIDAQISEASESPVGSCSQEQGQPTAAQSAQLGRLELEQHSTQLQSQAPLTIGQPVFHPAFGYGTVAALDG
jgi:hypothetical protein